MLAELVRKFPAVTVIDVSAILQQIREIMTRGSIAIEYVFLFTLGAGVLVLYAGIQASRELRRQESAILRTLGLKRNQLMRKWFELFAVVCCYPHSELIQFHELLKKRHFFEEYNLKFSQQCFGRIPSNWRT